MNDKRLLPAELSHQVAHASMRPSASASVIPARPSPRSHGRAMGLQFTSRRRQVGGSIATRDMGLKSVFNAGLRSFARDPDPGLSIETRRPARPASRVCRHALSAPARLWDG
ncbi:hypothetical protein AURDEDRAFT_178325 [Auricularia subglabra TFB-10046 SS5]|uniref:Uncharacterized protein n=1 Tax=Auricularia subglabra (strain TFB-10046 / SS5) TaxID=717982 RepID=J0WLE3_AURST|nr:hypothetical protein AURDEDRAFT_178325 [Auricularia subglabra TFB-10046 SS5]